MTGSKLRRAARRLAESATEGPDEASYAPFYERVGQQVAAQRAAVALSQRGLAELCGTTQSAIARLEAGRRAARLDTLLRVAHALGCELVVELRPRTRREGGRGGDTR